jgi:hypothetical protein
MNSVSVSISAAKWPVMGAMAGSAPATSATDSLNYRRATIIVMPTVSAPSTHTRARMGVSCRAVANSAAAISDECGRRDRATANRLRAISRWRRHW